MAGAPSARAAAPLALAAAILAAGFAPAAVGAAPKRGKLIERPVKTTAPAAKQVRLTHVRQYEPLPAKLGAPKRCDWLGYLRWRDPNGPRRAGRADAVLVVMPGLLGGASTHDALARNIVRGAARQGRHLELWSLDRRANCLEDHTGTDAAARQRDYRVALDYYWGGAEVGGRRFAGHKTDEQLPYLADFGLAMTMRDQYAVMRRAIPSRRLRRRKVLCGGHSLGGSLTAAYASWDFDGDPKTTADAGYNQCAGYFGLDTTVSNNLGGGSKNFRPAAEALEVAAVEGTRSGALPRQFASIPAIGPDTFEAVGVAGLAAYQRPGGSKLLAELPHTANVDLLLRMLLSRDVAAFATGTPDPRDYRLTNEALLGTIVDDNSQQIPSLQASVGTYDGGEVADKDMPVPNAVHDLPLAGEELSRLLPSAIIVPGASATRLMIPASAGGPLYRWRNYDRVGAADAPAQRDRLGEPFTSAASEVTDIRQFARALFEGPINMWEQYFPMRLQLDDIAFLGGARNGELAAVLHEDGPARRPYLEILAAEGVVTATADGPLEPGVEPRRRIVVAGHNHIDVATAAARTGDGKRDRVSTSLRRFALRMVGAR